MNIMDIFEHLNIALSKAINLSSRSSIAWVLMDSNSSLIDFNASKAGECTSTLPQTILNYSHLVNKLYISVEPTSGFFNLSELTETIEQSSIQEIIIGHKLDPNVNDDYWPTWCNSWPGKISISEHPGISDKISLGIVKLKKHNLPWVTAVSAANFSGASIKLNDLIGEFGFLSFVNDLCRQATAILVSKFHKKSLERILENEKKDEHLDSYQILDTDKIQSILRHCASEYKSHVVIFCDMKTLAYLIDNDLVDEIVHHTKNTKSNKMFRSIKQYDQQSETLLKLQDWALLQSSILGDCSQTTLSRQTRVIDTNESKRRLN